MRLRQFIKLTVGVIKHPVYSYYTFRGTNEGLSLLESGIMERVRLAADWLIFAQQKSTDGLGYSRKFSLIKGWDKGYIETTGYIIPTMLDVSDFLSDKKYEDSALQSIDWLLKKQLNNGAFPDIDLNKPQVFDTGQVLLGLNRMIKHSNDEKIRRAADSAAKWLMNDQEEDGSWVKHAYNFRPHSYYTRVAAALYEAGKLLNNPEYCDSALNYFDWVLCQQLENGFFRYSEFVENEPSLLHTIIYVLEGLIMIYGLTGNDKYLSAAVKGSHKLLEFSMDNELPYSRYDKNWQPVDKEYCVTGLAQWAGICCDLYKLTASRDFENAARSVLTYLGGVLVEKGEDIMGALPGSVPFWGYYGGMEYYNWNNKFYIDSMIKFSRININ